MTKAQQILDAREQRKALIDNLCQSHNVVTIKANVPGENKLIGESSLLIGMFTKLVLRFVSGRVQLDENSDGRCVIITFDGDAQIVKKQTVLLEDTHPLGRFVDIDVRQAGSNSSLSRGKLRKCFVCENPAFVCGRTYAHTQQQILEALTTSVRNYFSQQLEAVLKQSMLAELNLEDKFGLVTPTSQGSHPDMDYNLMVDAQNAITPYLVQMFWKGFDLPSNQCLLQAIRPIGLMAETAMNIATRGVNAYKGLIFVAGLLVASLGKVMSSCGDLQDVYTNVKQSCKNILKEFDNAPMSYGVTAFKLYGMTGARGHAHNGFACVQRAVEVLEYSGNLLQTLIYIVGNTDDTVLLKRSKSFDDYLVNKQMIASVDASDTNQVKLVNQKCVQLNLSIGGSADILVATVLISKIKELIHFNFSKK